MDAAFGGGGRGVYSNLDRMGGRIQSGGMDGNGDLHLHRAAASLHV